MSRLNSPNFNISFFCIVGLPFFGSFSVKYCPSSCVGTGLNTAFMMGCDLDKVNGRVLCFLWFINFP